MRSENVQSSAGVLRNFARKGARRCPAHGPPAGAVPQPSAARRAAAHSPCARCSPKVARAGSGEDSGDRELLPERASERASERVYPPLEDYLEDMEERSAETKSNVDSSAQPSVAQLAGRFREQAAVARETPASKPTRRKPPCSLPLFPPKVELGQNGEEKSPSSTSHPPKIKVKSSPLIEKLQANLAFDPAALLPGASPKSPGLKAMVSPFHSPPSTPSSPGIRSQPGEAEEVPVSFDQPPEGTHLPSYTKVRTRGSIKRRPPSRRFRRSQSDCGDILDYRAVEPSQENGAGVENGDDVFSNKSKAPRSRPPNQEAMGDRVEGTPESTEKPPQRSIYNSMEKPEEQVATPGETSAGEEAGQNPDTASQGSLEAPELPHTCSTEAENGCGSPAEGTATEEHTDTGKATDGTASEESVADEEEGEIREKPPQGSSGRVEGTIIPEVETKQKEGPPVEPGCSPGVDNTSGETSNEVQNDHEACMDDNPMEDTRM
ncbi:capZ-interacting protein isoform X2 [Cricetulus griseus]|uniref:CapZ-interacting protein isoform X2 n=2 Tax=Cricetulus griseus TaxID=10029 RepID=A0A9J7G2H2_CRIGR|nr:capZ-interacting protein isoform X2 [Cricetulus griseus]